MTENLEKSPAISGELNRNCVTIAEVLRLFGYRCYMVGKWHLSQDQQYDGPNDTWPLGTRLRSLLTAPSRAPADYFRPNGLARDNTRIKRRARVSI